MTDPEQITSASPLGADVQTASREGPVVTQAVWKLFFGDQDEILIREVGLSRNNDSPTLPSGFNCCVEGLGIRVFTRPGPICDIAWFARAVGRIALD